MIKHLMPIIAIAQVTCASVVDWKSGEMRVNGWQNEHECGSHYTYYTIITPTNAMPTNVWVECIAETNKTITPPTIKDPPVEPLEAAHKPTESTPSALLIAFFILVLALALSGPSGAPMVLLLIATTASAAPPPQRLARTIPPEIVAMVASNAPPGAHISYRFHRAIPFSNDRSYRAGDVVILPDGTAYIAIMNVFRSSSSFAVEPLLKTPETITKTTSSVNDATPSPAFFRAINPPIGENAKPLLISPTEPLTQIDSIKTETNSTSRLIYRDKPLVFPKRRVVLHPDSTGKTSTEHTLARSLVSFTPPPFGSPPPPIGREQLESNIKKVKIC